MNRLISTLSVAALLASGALATGMILMPDSTNNRMVAFNPFDGSVINPNMFALQGGTPIHALPVGNEIWVSEQVGDRISRWDYAGNLLGNIGGQFAGGGLDNIRGMGLVNNVVYVTNAGTANNAPGAAVVMFDTAGNNLGFFSTVGTAPSPFGILEHQGGILVSSSSANDDIHKYDLAGNSLGTFHNSTTLNFAEQMNYAANGNVLVAGFSSPAGTYELDVNTGAIVNSIVGSGNRGVIQLGNGNILWSNGSGVHIYDVGTNSSTLIYAGGGRYLEYTAVPEPASLLAIGAGLALLACRRRK